MKNKNLLRIIRVTLLSLICTGLNAQYHQFDTLKIKEVIITGRLISSEQPGYKFYKVDSASAEHWQLSSITDLLQASTPLFIKNYGSGGIATSSFRGTSAGHTQVAWNGININDPMLGQTDFSLVPSGMIDNIMVCFGGASMDIGIGAIGGIINLENNPDWNRETSFDITGGAGSFGRYSGLVKISTGKDNFRSITKAYLVAAENDYKYLDTIWKVRRNSELNQKGLMQEFYLKGSESLLSARFWYQSASRNLPGSILYYDPESSQSQDDNSFRGMLNYDASIGRAELIATAAWMSTGMNYDYLNPFFTINSRNRVNTLVVKGGITLPAGKFTKIKMVLSDENSTVKTNNYADTINHNTASLTISAERKMWKRLGMVILFRETIDDSRFLVPDFSAGAEFRLFSNEDHFLKLNFSRNTRIATLNDRYYNPGGNPDLKNEFAYSFESGYKMTQELSPLLQFSSEICYHNNLIRDMILWHETDPFVWVADNIGKVNSSGIEASASVKYSGTRMGFNIDGAYSYTRAKDAGTTDESVKDKQLMYIPENQVKGTTGIYFGNLFGRWETSYMGKIFTSADNSVSLKSYMLNNLTAGFKWKRGLFSGSIRVRIDNILNISYETIAGYPQPGRSFHTILSLSVR